MTSTLSTKTYAVSSGFELGYMTVSGFELG